MPNYLARMCAISLQSFAKGCIECSGANPLSAPGPRRFACPLRRLWDCTEASEKRRRFGAEECFFSGGAADRLASGQDGKKRPESG